jgi:serralysin
MMTTAVRNWVCATIDRPGGVRFSDSEMRLRARAAQPSRLWDLGTVLHVGFIGGDAALHDRVLTTARAWLVPGVNLKIAAARPGESSDIRVAFDEAGGSWSAVGKDSRLYEASQPTMNLGWARLDTPEKDFSSVVIHEFGHALGLLHQHNHPLAKISWNKAAVNADLRCEPNRWTQEMIDLNVYEAFDRSEVITTDFNAASVMIYTIPASWTLDGRSFMPSWKLSPGDAEKIRVLYG